MPRGQKSHESAMYLKAHRWALVAAILLVVIVVGALAPLGTGYCRQLMMDFDAEPPWISVMLFACPPWIFVLAAGVTALLLIGKEFVVGRALAFAFNWLAIFAVLMFGAVFVMAVLVPAIGLVEKMLA